MDPDNRMITCGGASAETVSALECEEVELRLFISGFKSATLVLQTQFELQLVFLSSGRDHQNGRSWGFNLASIRCENVNISCIYT